MDNQQQDLLKKKEEKPIQQQENSFSAIQTFTPPPSGIDPTSIVQPKKNFIQQMQERPIEERPEYFQPNIIQRLQELPEEQRPPSLQSNLIQQIQRKKVEEEKPQQVTAESRLKLPEEVQAKMENSFGADFSNVELYEGSNASNIGALAYTQGNQVHFAPGQFNPSTQQGQELIGHEFTHILQQRSGLVSGSTQAKGLPINDDVHLEQEADEMGKKAAQGQAIQGKFAKKDVGAEVVQKKEEEEPDFNALAKQVYEAIDGLQTNEDAVYNALKKLNRNADYIEKLKSTYKNLYQADLVEDIDGDFDFGSYDEVMVYLTPVAMPEDKPAIKTNSNVEKKPERPNPSNDIPISSNVGIKNPDPKKTAGKAYNSPEDVRKVQDQLYSLGYFPYDKYEKEKIDLTKEKSEIPVERIKETIAAIKEFQKIVRQAKNPDGVLSITGNDIKYLNTATKIPTKTEIAKINEARKEFKIITKISGEDEFKNELSKEVGDTTTGNIPLEVKTVQKRLIELNYLNNTINNIQYDSKDKAKIKHPGEDPTNIINFHKEKYKENKNHIFPEHLKITIQSLKNFQLGKLYKIDFWAKKLGRPNDYTIGKIKPNDVTFHLLKNVTKYTISTGNNDTASFKNYPKSGYTENPEGISYTGNISPSQFEAKELTKYGLTEKESKGLLEASSHEGNLDAINTYDSAKISFGFIQFAGGFVGNFPILLAKFKEDHPDDFKNLFQKYGIDVEFNYSLNKQNKKTITKAQMTIWDSQKSLLLRGVAAEEYLLSHQELLGILIQSAKNKNMQKTQLSFAINEYAIPSLNKKVGFKIKVIEKLKEDKKTIDKTYIERYANKYINENKKEIEELNQKGQIREYTIDLTQIKISDIISSEMGKAAIISLYINSPEYAILISRLALKEIIEADSINSLEEIKKINDKKVLNKIKELSTKETFKQRIDNIFKSNLSYEK